MAEEFEPSPRASKRRRIASQQEDNHTLSQRNRSVTTPLSKEKARRSDVVRNGQRSNSKHAEQDDAQTIEVNYTEDHQITDHEANEEHDVEQPRSSGRERKKPRRFTVSPEPTKTKQKPASTKIAKLNDPVQSVSKAKPATPKSILSPSKKGRTGARKSVTFDSGEKTTEAQLGFRDIDNSKTKLKTQPVPPTETPTKKRGRPAKPQVAAVQEVTRDTNLHEHDEPQSEDDGLDIDQLLEVQQWSVEQAPSSTVDVATLSLEDDPAMLGIKSEVLSRLLSSSTAARSSVAAHLQAPYQTIHNLLTATISAGESNSLLLLGSRGSGKTHLLKIALDDMRAKYADDFHTVRLNGFFQTDDKLALREIWRQLGREMKMDEEDAEAGSYADTMASLLSLLSHPDEFIQVDSAYSNHGVMSRSVIFVLDEFDLFTTHPRQTLLYNLFDIAQSRKAPIAVIGCSTRMDVVECLEKRVKSRFSHRWVHLPSAKSLDGLAAILETALVVDEQTDSHGKRSTKKEVEARKKWNLFIKTKFLDSTPVQDLLKSIFYTTKSIPDLFTALYLHLATLRVPGDDEAAVTAQRSGIRPVVPQLIDILPSLPTLQLALLVAACRLDTIHNLGAFNFNLVYDHYTELIARSKLQQTASGAVAVGAGLRQWTHDVAREAWEDLGEWGVLVPTSGNSASTTRDNAANNAGGGGEGASVRMWRVDTTLDDLVWALRQNSEAGSAAAAGAVDVLRRWCREI